MNRRRFVKSAVAASLIIPGAQVSAADRGPGRRLRIGQIGLGHPHASGKLDAIRKLSNEFELVGVVETDPSLRRRISGVSFVELDELLEPGNLDAVAVETPVPALIPMAARALNAGLHIHLDKPAGTDFHSFEKVVDIARNKNLTIQMGYMLRYNPSFQFLFRAVSEGWLGTITEVNAMMGKLADPGLRNDLAAYHGGGFFELACHILDATVFLLGKPDRVQGFHLRTGLQNGDTFADNQLAVLQYPEALAVLRCNHNDPAGFSRRCFNVTGTQGRIEIHPLESGHLTLHLNRPAGEYSKGVHDIQLPDGGRSYVKEFQDLADVIRGKAHLDWSYDHDLLVQKTLLEICNMPL